MPENNGLLYFGFPCDTDEKIKKIQAEFGLKGFALAVMLFQYIYGKHGYYCEWNEEEIVEVTDAPIDHKNMLVLAVATSIDALAVGITLAFLKVNIWAAASFIGMTTFIISAAGVKIGHVFGEKYTNKAELAGGLILMGIGVKILLEHLGVINF